MASDQHTRQLPSLEKLFLRYYKPLRAYAFRFVNRQDMAEDIVQDVFLELWARRDHIRFDETGDVKSYLFKSVYNRSINMLHSGYLNELCPIDDINETRMLESYLAEQMQNQEQSLLLKELETEIGDYVETLPVRCKEIFILSRMHGLKNREIAVQLGISIKAVEKQINKALSGLRQCLLSKDLLCIIYLFHELFRRP
jgi:RNA polymerase sigma-70 factor (ECF subfamily)